MNTQNPHEKTPSEKLRELIETYHGISAIPNEDLKIIGYVKTETGRVVRTDAREEIMKKENAAESLSNFKIQNIPFGRIPVRINRKEIPGRRLNSLDESETLKKKFDNWTYSLIDAKINGDKFLKDISREPELIINLYRLFKKYENEKKRKGILSDFNLFFSTSIMGVIDLEECKIPDYIFESIYENDAIKQETSQRLYEDLERLKGKYCDSARFITEFFSSINATIDFDGYNPGGDYGYNDDKIISYIKNEGIITNEDLIIRYFSDFLEWAGFKDLSDRLKQCKEVTEFIEILKSVKGPDLPSYNEEKQLKEQIKSAKTKEEKMELSQKLKIAANNLKNETITIKTLLELLTPYITITEYNRRKISDIQKYLLSGGKQEERDETFYLDGNPDEKLDRDPGAKSGDCTEGHPLPFREPLVPFYNIKVFNASNKHIGNIYLLRTHTADRFKENIWHLEAIQVPSSIDWDESIDLLIETLAVEAEKKGIEMITVNSENEKISNYDYISEAVLKYCKQRTGCEKIEIVYPDYNTNEYSSPQGDGNSLILWKNKKTHKQENHAQQTNI